MVLLGRGLLRIDGWTLDHVAVHMFIWGCSMHPSQSVGFVLQNVPEFWIHRYAPMNFEVLLIDTTFEFQIRHFFTSSSFIITSVQWLVQWNGGGTRDSYMYSFFFLLKMRNFDSFRRNSSSWSLFCHPRSWNYPFYKLCQAHVWAVHRFQISSEKVMYLLLNEWCACDNILLDGRSGY